MKKSKGANINAGAGNDVIYGSIFNDTIKGGDGDDEIHTNGGNDNIDGGNGSDKYYLFESVTENTTINDKGVSGRDVGIICSDKSLVDTLKSFENLYYNVDRSGSFNGIYAAGTPGTASMTGVEELQIKANGKLYKFNYDSVKNDIVAFLIKSGCGDVATVINTGNQFMDDITAVFTDANKWVQV